MAGDAEVAHDAGKRPRAVQQPLGILEVALNVALASLANFTLPGDLSASNRYYNPDLIDPSLESPADPDRRCGF